MNDKVKAFPSMEQCGSIAVSEGGMDLRDYFAAKCCAAMVSTIKDDADYTRIRMIALAHGLDSVSEFFAHDSYKQADALMKWREK